MHERTNGGGALASGQLEYLSCIWQNLSFLDHPHLHPTFSHIVAQRVLPYISTPLSLSRDPRRVRVRMFGYAKCSRASQVECLMALFCLNTDLDTTAERGVYKSAYVRPRHPRAYSSNARRAARLPRARFTLNYIKRNSVSVFTRVSRCDSAFQRPRPDGTSRVKFTRDSVLPT